MVGAEKFKSHTDADHDLQSWIVEATAADIDKLKEHDGIEDVNELDVSATKTCGHYV